MSGPTKSYDRAYFEKWYRGDGKVITPAARARKVAMVLGLTEFLIERPVRTVLDVGCGEAPWQPILRRLRPAARYTGVDPSPYVVERFGKRRNVRQGTFAGLGEMGLKGPFDLVVCSDALHYVSEEDVWKGLPWLAALLGGVAYLEVLTTDDEIVGDLEAWQPRPARFYRRAFDAAGLTPCGMQCWVGPLLHERVTAMERPVAEPFRR